MTKICRLKILKIQYQFAKNPLKTKQLLSIQFALRAVWMCFLPSIFPTMSVPNFCCCCPLKVFLIAINIILNYHCLNNSSQHLCIGGGHPDQRPLHHPGVLLIHPLHLRRHQRRQLRLLQVQGLWRRGGGQQNPVDENK